MKYTIYEKSAHRFLISLTFSSIEDELELYLPVWIAGSYMRRDYAKYLTILEVKCNNKATLKKVISPSKFKIIKTELEQELNNFWEIKYEIFAFDLSVRGNYLDDERFIFNPTAACLAVRAKEEEKIILEFITNKKLFGKSYKLIENKYLLNFNNYQDLIDTPILADKNSIRKKFILLNKKFNVVFSGFKELPDFFIEDLKKVLKAQFEIFGSWATEDFDYDFLLFFRTNCYGGLEHQNSTLLMFEPKENLFKERKDYLKLLGLFAHEFFHSWNVKKIRPCEYLPNYPLEAEAPHNMLWFFEGWTAYFDNLSLYLAGVITKAEYGELLAQDITNYKNRLGRKFQTLAESSIEAWTKLYQGGENAPNSSTSYYIQGSLAAWCLDAWLQERAGIDLKEIICAIFKNPLIIEKGLNEERFLNLVLGFLKGKEQKDFLIFFKQLIHSTAELPLEKTAEFFGFSLIFKPEKHKFGEDKEKETSSNCGFAIKKEGEKFLIKIDNPDSPAMQAGLSLNDEILEINQQKIKENLIASALFSQKAKDLVQVKILREGEEKIYNFELIEPKKSAFLVSN